MKSQVLKQEQRTRGSLRRLLTRLPSSIPSPEPTLNPSVAFDCSCFVRFKQCDWTGPGERNHGGKTEGICGVGGQRVWKRVSGNGAGGVWRNAHDNNTQPAVGHTLRFWSRGCQRRPNRTGSVRVAAPRLTQTRKQASDGDWQSDGGSGCSGTHLCGIIFSAVSPSIMVTLLLLMCAPLGLDPE